jgi:predicted  nucleic acid-binding Zn-ribbon protein
MKKAFEQNVSRAKPRLRLGAFTGVVDPAAPEEAQEPEQAQARPPEPEPEPSRAVAHHNDLSTEVRARVAALRAPAVQEPRAAVEPPAPEVEIQTPPSPREELDPSARRERLKERLKAVRENPRPEPLPASVAEAGLRAVERISALQTELTKVKALNLTLTQDLEVSRRQAEKATEEARLRMDEARRLAADMEGRVKLLGDLERELAALEGERDEALLSLQEARQALQAAAQERTALEAAVAEARKALTDSLSEEERLAGELEVAKDEAATLRRAVDALQGERDVLAQQVASLTAERTELLEARKALEAVHRALSQAVVR